VLVRSPGSAGITQWVGVGFHTDAVSPLWKAATTFAAIA